MQMTKVAELPDDTVSELTDTDSVACQGDNEASGLISADDLVPAIREAAALLIRAEVDRFTTTLRLQIELGKLLNQAKDACEHGEWTKWFEAKQFPFSMRKAQRAMRFANFEPELLAWAKTPAVADLASDDRLGVVDAETFIENLEEEREEKAIADAEAASELEAVLSKIDPDNAAKVIGRVWDQQKCEQFVAMQLKAMHPERVFHLLLDTFGYEQLAAQLSTHLKSHVN
jgi:hypothetical protein